MFVASLFLTLPVMVALCWLDEPLKTEAAPLGMVSLELAGDPSVARDIIASWGQTRQVYAGLSLGLDYLFLVGYATTIGLACVLVARSPRNRFETLAAVGELLAWGQIAAALLDGVENYGLIRVLLGTGGELWPGVARWCAMAKFAIVATGLVYTAVGVVIALVRPDRKHAA